ncbi:helix-turn-helix domain-containing protein [Citricoccus sp. NR2]|uniref:helix-turn-helix domain-containing protein n=1 Tax=Citricoccus sp. NR2 TaxID=3004095 RepID=UPI0022DD4450|nr:PucR family transcriptional regulator [Citricoccus sp. NR2]WBL20086.1 PucR family transcriptional regulator ligand-binding domain-containing protein [Citricoccus sp. NR2]
MPEPVIHDRASAEASMSVLSEEWLWPTVQQMVNDERIDVRLVHGEAVAHRGLRVAFASEMTDPSEFLRGGELLLTTGIGWGVTETRRAEAARTMIHAAAQVGVAAVGFGTGPWAPSLPLPLVEAARERGVPLVHVPISTPFLCIVEWVDAAHAKARRSRSQRREVGALLQHVRRGHADVSILSDAAPGWSASQRAVGAVCHAADLLSDGRMAVAERCLDEYRGALIWGERDRQIIVVGTPDALDEYRRRCLDPMQAPYGVGSPQPWTLVRGVLAEAWYAAEIARRRGRAAHGHDLASVDGLLMALTPEQVAPFRTHLLDPLRRYDAVHRADLVRTVSAFIESEGSLNLTAQLLFVHINTVRKRLRRVEQLVGADPLDREGYLVLRVALSSGGFTGSIRPAG